MSSFCADVDWGLGVTARIWNGGSCLRSLLISQPPCFPVAPVMRVALIVNRVQAVQVGEKQGRDVDWTLLLRNRASLACRISFDG